MQNQIKKYENEKELRKESNYYFSRLKIGYAKDIANIEKLVKSNYESGFSIM